LKFEIKEDEKNKFKYFWRFMAANESFLIPIDHENFKDMVVDE
jgi:hypothetical protein